jgi:hypothetical protein
MMHGRQDRLFPVAGYEQFEQTVGRLYKSYGIETSFGNVVVDTDHKDSDFLRERAIRFFDKHLMKIADRKLDMDYSNAPPEQLSVFGGNPPADAINFRVHETFTTRRPSARFPALPAWESRRTKLLTEIRNLLPVDPTDDTPIRTDIRKPKEIDGKLPALLYIASDGEDISYINDVLSGVNRRNESIRMTCFPHSTSCAWNKGSIPSGS